MHFPILVVCFETLFWKCFLGWWCFRWRLWYIKYIENNTWTRRDMEFRLDISRVNTKRAIPYLQAIMCYFVYYINILLTRRNRLNSRFKKRTRCLSFMALNRASATNWLPSQTHVKNYRNFSRVMIRFFSAVKIPINHSSLNSKTRKTHKSTKHCEFSHCEKLTEERPFRCPCRNLEFFRYHTVPQRTKNSSQN